MLSRYIKRSMSSLALHLVLTASRAERGSPGVTPVWGLCIHTGRQAWRHERTRRERIELAVRASSSSSSSSSSRGKQLYRCSECGETTLQWSGQCMACKAWGTLEKTSEKTSSPGGSHGGARAVAMFQASKARHDYDQPNQSKDKIRRSNWISSDSEVPQKLSDVSQRGFKQQWRINLPGESGQELNRVLGGGVVPGSLVLVGGEPGVGKSTLLLQLSNMMSVSSTLSANADTSLETTGNFPVLYVSGEESSEQIGSRAERLGVGSNSNVYLYSATRLELILEAIVRLQPSAVIIDSIQTIYLDDINSSAGSVVQVRECASALLQVAKRERVPIFLVGHVTKTGDIAGPRVLEHIVDVVLYIEGGRQQGMRLLRCVKNRYGATDEVGVFAMEEQGLRAVPNPSAFFRSSRESSIAVSSAVSVVLEGTRPLAIEVQALCTSASQGNTSGPPLRVPTGIRKERLWLILAVLAKHTGVRTYGVDVHINITGGLTVSEPAADLAIAASIASSYYDKPLAQDLAFLGEVGLGGEVRQISQIERRISELVKLGFQTIIVPQGSPRSVTNKQGKAPMANVIQVKTVLEAFEFALGALPSRRRSNALDRKNFGNDDSTLQLDSIDYAE